MALRLPEAEIRRRMIQWNNWKKENPKLREENRRLKLRVRELEAELVHERRERMETVEALKLQIEELREMVFGRKRNEDAGTEEDMATAKDTGKDPEDAPSMPPRSKASYRRRTPKEHDVTKESFHGIDRCPVCGEPLVDLREIVRYLEDIVLPALSGMKTCEKQRIETGFCGHCQKRFSALPVSPHISTLGSNVRSRIVFCVTILKMSYADVSRDLHDTFGMDVSDGEIAAILTTEAAKVLPEYHAIEQRIRDGPCSHRDETSWPVQTGGEGNHGWVSASSTIPDTLFRLGRSRGKGNATILRGDPRQPTVTDDYAAYDDLWEKHGLCWAHPRRKFRDLASSPSLRPSSRYRAERFSMRFISLLRRAKLLRKLPYDRGEREHAAVALRKTIMTLCAPDSRDPKKLATLKATFLAHAEQYLLCVREKDVPMTNNRAESAIRPLVLKRAISHGSKSQKGADVLSVLYSVCRTLWGRKPVNFYQAYAEIVQKWQSA